MVLNNSSSKKIIEELRKSNKELDSYFKDIDIDIENLNNLSEGEEFAEELLTNAVIDLRTEVSGLKRKLLNEVDRGIELYVGKKFKIFGENMSKLLSTYNQSLRTNFSDNLADFSLEITNLKKDIHKDVESTSDYIKNIQVELLQNIQDLKQSMTSQKKELNSLKEEVFKLRNKEMFLTPSNQNILENNTNNKEEIELCEHLIKDIREEENDYLKSKIKNKKDDYYNVETKIIDIETKIKELDDLALE